MKPGDNNYADKKYIIYNSTKHLNIHQILVPMQDISQFSIISPLVILVH